MQLYKCIQVVDELGDNKYSFVSSKYSLLINVQYNTVISFLAHQYLLWTLFSNAETR